MSAPRQVRFFRSGRNQAVRIPVEFELPGKEATIRRVGDRLIIEPIKPNDLLAFLESLEPIDEEFPEINDPPIEPEDIL